MGSLQASFRRSVSRRSAWRLHSRRAGAVRLATASAFVLAVLPVLGVASAGSTAAATGTNGAVPVAPSEHELAGLRSQGSDTYVEVNGLHKTVFSAASVNYRDGNGAWQPIDSSLAASPGGGWHIAANSWSAQLPSNLSGPVSLSNGSSSVAFTLDGAAGSGTVSGSTATYRGVLPATTVSYKVLPGGVKETLQLASGSAPSAFTWSLGLGSGLTAVATGGGLALDAAGRAVAAMSAPTVTDGAGRVGPAALTLSADGGSVTLSVDSAWLAAPGRVFPVTVDPTTSWLSTNDGCTLSQATPTTASCYSTDLGVGYSGGNIQRAVVHYGDMSNGAIPLDAVVESASIGMPVDSLTGSVTVNAYPLSRAYSNSAVTWNSYDGTNAWTAAGGDYTATPTASGTVPSSGTFSMHLPTSLAQSWVDGGASNNGLVLKASNESSGTNLADFYPEDDWSDTLTVYWSQNTAGSSYPMYSHTLDDHLSVGVNTANGNLVVHATDLKIAGTGLNEVVDRYYNSTNQGTFSSIGYGWSFGQGAGVTADENTDNVTLTLPGGIPTVLLANGGGGWTTPPGVDAVLTKPSSGHYTLTYNQSQAVLKFTVQSSCPAWLPLTSAADRNGETITYAYTTTCDSSGEAIMSSITDTQGRVTTFANNGYFVTGVTDPQTPTGRTVGYDIGGYSTSQLVDTTDTSGHKTYFTYDSADSYMTQIQDPNGNYTKIAYDSLNRVQSITYVTNTGTMTGPTYTFAYTPGSTSSPDSGYTTVTDPNSHTTSYYYNHLDLQTKVTDGNSNSRTGVYNADNQPTTLTDALSPGATTVLGYQATTNNLQSITATASASGQTAASTNWSYNTSSSDLGHAYLPSSSVDPQNNCTSGLYDPTGNATTVYEGLTPSGGNCDGATGNDYAAVGHQGDSGVTSCNGPTGVVCTTRDPNGHTTTYGYDGTTKGNLTSVTPPSPLGATAITYDSLSRVSTVTDGNGSTGTPGTIVAVQNANTTSSSPVSSQTTTLPANTTKGDTVVVVVTTSAVSPVVSVSSVSGGGVGTWTNGITKSSTGVGDEEIWYGYANTGGAAAITVTMSAGTATVGNRAIEFTGVASSSPLDDSRKLAGATSTVNTPSLTTTAAGDMVIAGADVVSAVSTSPGSPWVNYGTTGSYAPSTTRIAPTTGAYSTSWTTTAAAAWVSVGIALKPTTQSTSATYDAMDRITQILYGGDTACVPTSGNCITYTYDNDGNLSTRVDNTGTTTLTYDAMNRLTKEALPSGADACSGSSPAGITYTYDTASNVATSCQAAGTTSYTYDPANELVSMTEPGGTAGCTISPQVLTTGCTAFAYDNDGKRTITQFPGGATQTVAYLLSGLTSSMIGKTSAGVVDTSFIYTYTSTTTDKVLLYTKAENDPSTGNVNVTTTYTYDADNRLTVAAVGGGTTYNYYYDAAGNRCSAAATGTPALCPTGTGYYAYNSTNEMTASPAGGTYTYDANGNQTAGYSTIAGSSKAITETYNSLNQTNTILPSGGSAVNFSYTDAGSSQRTAVGSTTYNNAAPGGSTTNQVVTQTTSGATTNYLYDPSGNLIGEHIGTTSYYYLHDITGSIVGVVGTTGTIANRYEYDPYGNIVSSYTTIANPWLYAGGYSDTTTGLLKYGTRYYNPTNGRWTQQDNSSGNPNNPQTLDRYTYAGDNPTNFTDPTGMSFLTDAVSGVVGTLGGAIGFGLGGPIGAGIVGGCLTAATNSSLNGGSGLDVTRGCAEYGALGGGLAGLGMVAAALLG